MKSSRREFLRQGGLGGVGLLTFNLAGCEKQMSPATARLKRVPLQVLSVSECATLEALAESLVPGSVSSGVAHFIDHQLAATHADCMLMIKYLGVNPPFTPFYQGGIAALDALAIHESGNSFEGLAHSSRTALVTRMASGGIANWEGPPSEFFFFVLRSDAIDVRYGTAAGFADLGIPYMAHIEPASQWGEQN